MYHSFESLEVWKRASRLAVEVYRALENSKDFGLRSQMTRAAVSVASNIAEGYERGFNKEFVRYLNIAKGSAAELRTQLYIAGEVGQISTEQRTKMVQETREIASMLKGLADARKSSAQEDDTLPPADTLNLNP
ncbi:MAG: four helix bundle protein [Wenzhouxiangella sp.]|nr:MAG: four helix bundle protein [Wenzhouxiangella sp.]